MTIFGVKMKAMSPNGSRWLSLNFGQSYFSLLFLLLHVVPHFFCQITPVPQINSSSITSTTQVPEIYNITVSIGNLIDIPESNQPEPREHGEDRAESQHGEKLSTVLKPVELVKAFPKTFSKSSLLNQTNQTRLQSQSQAHAAKIKAIDNKIAAVAAKMRRIRLIKGRKISGNLTLNSHRNRGSRNQSAGQDEQSSSESEHYTYVNDLRPSLFHPASSEFEKFELTDAIAGPGIDINGDGEIDDFLSEYRRPTRMPMPGEYMMEELKDIFDMVEKMESETRFHPDSDMSPKELRKLLDMHMEISNMIFQEGEKTGRHSCYRECSTDPASRMTCSYNFTVANYYVLSPHCMECPNVTMDCARPGCIAADGRPRAIAVVNKLMPGPAIRVCEGDTIVVDVMNNLAGQTTSIHWHGIHQRSTPWMDGAPFVTQCPIPEGTSFRYEFDVPLAGTNYWHSHDGVQRADGVFGALVVRKPEEIDMQAQFYDYDLAEHEIIVWDWLSALALQSHIIGHVTDERERVRSILVNGKGFPPGFFNDFYPYDTLATIGKPFVPIHEVRIKEHASYRFRLISNGVTLCPVEFSIENHNLLVIASDGVDMSPVSVASLVIHAGERWDFVVRGDQIPGSYWMKFRGLVDCNETQTYQLAVLNYDQVPMGELPPHIISFWEEAAPFQPGLQLSPLNIAPGNPEEHITVAQISSAHDDDPQIIEQEFADHQFYLGFDFNPVPNVNFGKPTADKSMRQLMKERIQTVHFLPQFNFISHSNPQAPPLTQPETINSIERCNADSKRAQGVDCTKTHCQCTHWLTVELNSIVELVLVDMGVAFDAAHDFHLHGHSFRVLAIEKLGNTTDPAYVQELDRQGLIQRRRSLAVIKDTVYVPDGGYTIIRFRANNPGFWLFHCHIEFHAARGMGLIIQVGHPHDTVPPPRKFPRCGNYAPPGPPSGHGTGIPPRMKNLNNPFIPSFLTRGPPPSPHPPPPLPLIL